MFKLLPLDENERITSILPIEGYDEDQFIFMATANGTVKKTAATQFARQRSVGLRAIELDEDDVLVGTAITDGNSDIMLFSVKVKQRGLTRAKSARWAELPAVSEGSIWPMAISSFRLSCPKRAVVS